MSDDEEGLPERPDNGVFTYLLPVDGSPPRLVTERATYFLKKQVPNWKPELAVWEQIDCGGYGNLLHDRSVRFRTKLLTNRCWESIARINPVIPIIHGPAMLMTLHPFNAKDFSDAIKALDFPTPEVIVEDENERESE